VPRPAAGVLAVALAAGACSPDAGPPAVGAGPRASGPCDAWALPDQRICLRHVSPGSFRMGSPATELGHEDREASREVTLTRAFEIGVFEVGQAEFVALMGYDPSAFSGCPTCPVESITWNEAAAFANALSAAAGLEACFACAGSGRGGACDLDARWPTPYACPGYRMPTEAEWEYAARAGEEASFPGGGDLRVDRGYEDDCRAGTQLDDGSWLEEQAWYTCNAGGRTHPTGLLRPNGLRLYDVLGNVLEWCFDRYDAQPASGPAVDPWGGAAASARAKRGGSWHTPSAHHRFAYRNGLHQPTSDDHLGLRLARTP